MTGTIGSGGGLLGGVDPGISGITPEYKSTRYNAFQYVNQFLPPSGGYLYYDSDSDTFAWQDVDLTGDLVFSVEEGITASTTQSQGQQPLVETANEIAVVANAGDTVTMPAATAGKFVWVTHNGAKNLQIFPASGDNFEGVAVDASITMYNNASGEFGAHSLAYAQDADTWQILTNIIHGYCDAGTGQQEIAFFTYAAGSSSTELHDLDDYSSANASFGFKPGAGVINEYLKFTTNYAHGGMMWLQATGDAGTPGRGDIKLVLDGPVTATAQLVFALGQSEVGSAYEIMAHRDADLNENMLHICYETDDYDITDVIMSFRNTGAVAIETTDTGLYIMGAGNFAEGQAGDSTEFLRLYHNSTNAVINSGKTNVATAVSLLIQTDSVTAITVDTSQQITLSTIPAGVADYDTFLVSDGGMIKYRTGAQVLSDIGGVGAPAGSDTQVQYNDSGSFGASANLIHNGTHTRIAADTKLYFNT